MTKTASLTSALVTKKGQASPAVMHQAQPLTAKAETPDYYKALTVKLNRERYEALKTLGLKLDKKSQEILVEALDLYLLEAKP